MKDRADIPPPRARADFLGAAGLEQQLAAMLAGGALANGWLITGGEGAGKATLAYRLARALLWPDRPADATTLEVPASTRTFALVASGGHPDMFVAERQINQRTDRLYTEILVESARDLTHFLKMTPSMGGWRVAIIDSADDLNRNAANALLKALEEPPARTAVFVLSSAPGRLLPTIRSRCRRIDLRPLPDDIVAKFLVAEGGADDEAAARAIARAAGGRPGFALSLAVGEGATAISAVDDFFSAVESGRDVAPVAQRIAAKDSEGAWPHFHGMLIDRIAERARAAALSGDQGASRLVELRERIDSLFGRGDAVNLDRFQMVLAAARAFQAVVR